MAKYFVENHEMHQNVLDTQKRIKVVSLIIFYNHRNTIMNKILVSVIYSILEKSFVLITFVCINTSYQSKIVLLRTQDLTISLRLEYIMYWCAPCHVKGFQGNNSLQLSYHDKAHWCHIIFKKFCGCWRKGGCLRQGDYQN